jgi:TPP-dependent pyruvate/acetoin dehydrogenase alpha subunit
VTAAELLRGLYRVRALERAAGRDPDPASLLAPTVTAFALASRPPDLLTVCAGAAGATVLRGLDARDLARHQADAGGSGYPTRSDLGLLGPVPSRGVSLSVAAGAALAFGLRKERRVAVVIDDASALQSGGWHEGLGLAAARGVPLVAVLMHRTDSRSAGAGLRRAEAYGVHAERLVADDADALARRIHRIVDSARTRPSPWLVEIVSSDRDPIARLETRVIVAEPEDPASMSARDRLARWAAEAEAEARDAWRGLEVAA